MKTIEMIEPGVLRTFRLMTGVQVAIAALGMIAHRFALFRMTAPSVTAIAFSLLEPGLLLLYLSLPGLRRLLKAYYLPVGIAWAAAGPILDPYVNLAATGTDSAEAFLQVMLWRQIILLLIPLVVVSWQYSVRQVIFFCALMTGVNVALLFRMTGILGPMSVSILGIVLVQPVAFLVVGHMISDLVRVQREQRQRLTEANVRLAQQASTLEQLVVSRERNRLARELHDVLAHTLSGVAVELEGARVMQRVDPERAQALLSHSLQAIREGLTETRRALNELRAKPLEDLGLTLAVRTLAESYAGRYALQMDLSVDRDLINYSVEVQQCVYRIAQEALDNVANHARAQHVQVVLKQERDELRLIIRDDGCGFDPSAVVGSHYGLVGMRERADMIGGRLSVQSQNGKGTRISFSYGGTP